METNEIIALALGLGILAVIAIYESIMHRMMKNRLREARDNAAAWKNLYRAIKEERDLLNYRVQSKECQKVLAMQDKLDDAMEEIDRLAKLNETYKRQLEKNGKKKAAPGNPTTESSK